MEICANIDKLLLDKASTLSGLDDLDQLLNAALQTLIQRESAIRLAKLGGSQPDLKDIPRRRSALPKKRS